MDDIPTPDLSDCSYTENPSLGSNRSVHDSSDTPCMSNLNGFSKVPTEDPFLDSLDNSFLVLSRERHGTDEGKNEDSSCENSGPFKILIKIRISNVNRLIIGQLNINSIRNKSEALQTIVSDNLNILVITESKLDSSCPAGRFCMEGFPPPFRLDRNVNGDGVLIYVREDTTCRELKDHPPLINVEDIFNN